MKKRFFILAVTYLIALNGNFVESSESIPTLGTKSLDAVKDLDVSASDRTFLVSRDYGNDYAGSYGGGPLYSSYPGLGGNSIYGSSTTYRGTGLGPGYRGYQTGGQGGIIGGGHTGYGYYGTSGYGPSYGGYGGGVGGYGTSGLGYGGGTYDGYSGYGGRGGYGGYGGYSGNGYGSNYGGRNGYDPYSYRGSYGGSNGGYDGYGTYPSGYRGYS